MKWLFQAWTHLANKQAGRKAWVATMRLPSCIHLMAPWLCRVSTNLTSVLLVPAEDRTFSFPYTAVQVFAVPLENKNQQQKQQTANYQKIEQ